MLCFLFVCFVYLFIYLFFPCVVLIATALILLLCKVPKYMIVCGASIWLFGTGRRGHWHQHTTDETASNENVNNYFINSTLGILPPGSFHQLSLYMEGTHYHIMILHSSLCFPAFNSVFCSCASRIPDSYLMGLEVFFNQTQGMKIMKLYLSSFLSLSLFLLN